MTGAAAAVRRTELSPAVLRFEARLARAACLTMAVFLGAGCAWIADRRPGPGSLFRPGVIDVAGLAVMALALATGWQAARQAARMTPSRWTRRRVLTLGLAPAAVLACAAAGGTELVSRGVLPGRTLLDELDGACSVPDPPLAFAPLGPSIDGAFYSAARRRTVGYTIAYPPGHRRGAELPLVVMLHGYGGNHTDALAGMSAAQAVALKPGGQPLPPMALVTVDGGAATGTRTPATTRWRW